MDGVDDNTPSERCVAGSGWRPEPRLLPFRPSFHPLTPNQPSPEPRLRGRCFDGALVTTLLGDSGGLGYGLPERRAVMTFVDELAGMEVEWTLGVALTLSDPEPLLQKVRLASHYWVQQLQLR
jgi:hypothetical protein